MNEELLAVIRDAIREEVKITVNGKIDASRSEIKQLREDLKTHMEKVEPYLAGVLGLNLLWKILVGVGAISVAVSQVKGLFTH